MVRLAGTVARLPRYLNLAQALARDPAVPRRQKLILGAAIGYAILPVDLIPGIIPVVGQLDDLAALLLGLRQALAGCPPDLAQAHLDRVRLSTMSLDADLQTVRLTAIWLARSGVSLGRRALSVPLRLLGRRAGPARARA